MERQATVGLEILMQSKNPLDDVFVFVSCGGLIAGLSSVFNHLSPKTKIIGVEPEGALAMKVSLSRKQNTTLDEIDTFVDGAAGHHRVGDLNFTLVK